MTGDAPALLAAAAGVGFGHAVLPDHWVPLAVLGRTRRYSLSRVARLSGLAGVTHVLVSVVLGAIVIAVGLQFRSTIESAQDTIIGGILIATGIGFALMEATGHGHTHDHEHGHEPHDHEHERHDHEHGHEPHDREHDHAAHDHEHEHVAHDHEHEHVAHHDPGEHASRRSGLAAIIVPFGAAASPDLTILPVFLAAASAGIATAIGSLVIFAAVTIGTIVGLTLAATRGGYEIQGKWLERWGNLFTAGVLVAIGGLILAGVI